MRKVWGGGGFGGIDVMVLLARELELFVWDAKSGIWEVEATQGAAWLEGVVFHM